MFVSKCPQHQRNRNQSAPLKMARNNRKRARDASDGDETSINNSNQGDGQENSRDGQNKPRRLCPGCVKHIQISPLTEDFTNTSFLEHPWEWFLKPATPSLRDDRIVNLSCASKSGQWCHMSDVPLALLRRFAPAVDQGIRDERGCEDHIESIFLYPVASIDGISYFVSCLESEAQMPGPIDEIRMVSRPSLEEGVDFPLYCNMAAYIGSVALGLPVTVILKERIKQKIDFDFEVMQGELAEIYKLRLESDIPPGTIQQPLDLTYLSSPLSTKNPAPESPDESVEQLCHG